LSHADFLAIACKQKFVLDEYVDEAVGHMEKNAEGKLAITRVTLKPKLKFSATNSRRGRARQMHHGAHRPVFHRELGENGVTVEK